MFFLTPVLIGAALGAAVTWSYINLQSMRGTATVENEQEPAVQEISVTQAADSQTTYNSMP